MILDRCRFEIPDEAVMMTEQKRVVWAVPWGERVYVGCTDTDFQNALEDVHTEPEDVRYILDVVNNFFPALKLTEADVLSSWAGVRPLVAAANGTPSEVSRSHLIKMSRGGWIDAAGGKLTTYRLMAQEIIDKAGRYLDKPLAPCRTAREPLLSHGEADGVSSVVPPPVTPRAVRVYCHREWAVHLEDVMIRRTRWHYYEPDKEAVAEKVAGWMAEELRWDGPRRRAEMERYCRVRD